MSTWFRGSKRALLEPGDTREQWTGEAAAPSSVQEHQWLCAIDLRRQPPVSILTL
jgi:hypothetical protein